MSKYVLLKNEFGIFSLKIPFQFCTEFETLQIVDEETLSKLILHEQQTRSELNFWLFDCFKGCNRDDLNGSLSVLSLKQGDFYVVYKQKDIIYIEASGSYSNITILDQKQLTVTFSLMDIEPKLSRDIFLRIHRSVIININYVTKFIGNTIYLGEKTFPVGRKFKKSLINRLNLVCGSKKIISEEYLND